MRTESAALRTPRPLWRSSSSYGGSDVLAAKAPRCVVIVTSSAGKPLPASTSRAVTSRMRCAALDALLSDVASSTSGSGGRALTMALTASFSAASSWCSSRYASMTARSFSAACISRDAISPDGVLR